MEGAAVELGATLTEEDEANELELIALEDETMLGMVEAEVQVEDSFETMTRLSATSNPLRIPYLKNSEHEHKGTETRWPTSTSMFVS
jgi:hypothetical protein